MLGKKYLSALGSNERPSLLHSSPYTLKPTGTHNYSTPTFYWDKEGKADQWQRPTHQGCPGFHLALSTAGVHLKYKQQGPRIDRRPQSCGLGAKACTILHSPQVKGGGNDANFQKGRVLLCRWRRESYRQEVLSTCLQEQISPSRWVLREGGKFTLTVDRNGCVQKEKMLQFP